MVAPSALKRIKTFGVRKTGITPFAKTWLAPYNVLTAKRARWAERDLFKNVKIIFFFYKMDSKLSSLFSPLKERKFYYSQKTLHFNAFPF